MGAWAILAIVQKKSSHLDDVLHVLEQLEKAKFPRWEPGGEAPRRGAILAIFQKKIALWMTFYMFLEQLEKAKLLR